MPLIIVDRNPVTVQPQNSVQKIIRLIIILLPSVAAMYGLFWMEKNDIWTIQNKLRDILTIGLMTTGLIVSFLLFTKLTK